MTHNLHFLRPELYGYYALSEAVFALVCFLVAMLALKASRITSSRQARHLFFAFMLISLSYITQAALNIVLNTGILGGSGQGMYEIFEIAGIYSFVVLMNLGLLVMVLAKSKEGGFRMLFLLSVTSFAAIFMSSNMLGTFYILSTLYLLSISYDFMRNYMEKMTMQPFMTMLSFLLLLTSSVAYIFLYRGFGFYLLGHISEFSAYVTMLINLYTIVRK